MSDPARNCPERLGFPAVAVLVAIALTGCPKPIDFGPRGVITDPQVLLTALEDRNASLGSAQGDARANIDTPKGGGGVDLYVVAQEPNRFRLEAINFFGQPIGVLATDGEAFAYLDMQSGQFVEGPATPENVSKLLPVVVPADELTSILLGEVPDALLDEVETAGITVDQEARAYRLDLRRDAGLTQRLWIAPPELRPIAYELPAREIARMSVQDGYREHVVRTYPGYRVEFDDFDGPRDRPKTIRLATIDRQYRVELKWRDRELEPDIDPALFTVQRPALPVP